MSTQSRTVVGIDLGTSNSALAWATPSEEGPAPVEVLPVPQVVRSGMVESRSLLPSAVYLPHPAEQKPGAFALPWTTERSFCVGLHARTHGAQVPGRLVSSAKSWLSFAGADRRGDILPWEAPADVARISPVESARRILEHLAESWQHAHGTELSAQEVVLTVPASFDAVARELTVQAARGAGLQVSLLEEPQAAVYAWLAAQGDGWRQQLRVGDMLLVVDIGGGTTDLSLVSVEDDGGSLELRRLAVGDHLLLGGDNMDLALAHTVRAKLQTQGKTLDPWQFQGLVHACREAKEALLASDAPETVPVTIAGRGSSLLGGAIRAEITRSETLQLLVDGFFPAVGPTDLPRSVRRSALSEVNLPYAQDPAITRHLAAFLAQQAPALAGRAVAAPTTLLFNGGVLRSPVLRQRIVDTLQSWNPSVPLRVLEAADLDLAVAKGAAAFALSRLGRGIRIRGGTARAYYIGVESGQMAVPGLPPPVNAYCVAPFALEEGSSRVELDRTFVLEPGEEAAFRLYASSTYRDDGVGAQRTGDDPGLHPLPDVTTRIDPADAGGLVRVRIGARVTDIGTLALDVRDTASERAWTLELNIRSNDRGQRFD